MPELDPTDETFASALSVLSHLRDQGDLLISLAPPFSTSIEIERTVLEPHLDRANVSEADIRATASEASDILRALLEGLVDEYVDYRLERAEVEDEERADIDAALRKRVSEVQEGLHDDRLRRRYALKQTSKAPAFSAITWDIKTKTADSSKPDLEAFPYATCRISYQKAFDDSPWSVLGNPFDSAQINFTADEVRYVIRVLQTVQTRLESAEHERGV